MTYWQFNQLATYNSEVARGIAHTLEWKASMVRLQAEFDEEMKADPFGRHSWDVDLVELNSRRPWYLRLFV